MQDIGMQFHIRCQEGDVGRYCFLPGDPGRCEAIAKHFDNPVHVGMNREYNIWNGTLLGEKVTVCSTGIGVSVAANKVKGIRCALLSDLLSARLTREHNDTNMMAMGAFIVGEKLALEIVDTWLTTEFSHGERHVRRLQKLAAMEE